MNIIITAFAFSPFTGSEGGVGWNYVLSLAKEHNVTVITDISRKSDLAKYDKGIPDNINVIFYRPKLLVKIKLNSFSANIIFFFWMQSVWRLVDKIKNDVNPDFCWHLTYGVFRHPCLLYKTGLPVVIGPVGGGEESPFFLLKGLPGSFKIKEFIRYSINKLSPCLPGFKAGYNHAAAIFCRTHETKAYIPSSAQGRVYVEQEIGGVEMAFEKRSYSSTLKVLYAGRLLYWKGISIALSAFALFIQQGGKGCFTIVGDGEAKAYLQELAKKLNIESFVNFLSTVPRGDLFSIYKNNDVLLFPSFHDSGGNVVIEAMSAGLPVICLKLGGPAVFVESGETGFCIDVSSGNVNFVEHKIAECLLSFHANHELLGKMALASLERSKQITYEGQIKKIVSIIKENIKSQV